MLHVKYLLLPLHQTIPDRTLQRSNGEKLQVEPELEQEKKLGENLKES